MKKCIVFILFISTLLMGCNKNELIYNAPTNEQITDYVNSHRLDLQDSIWIKDSAIILLENSLITLYTDQHGKVYDQKLSWGINYSDPVTVGNGNPYIAVIINNKMLSSGADRIFITYTDGKSYSRGITEKKGYLIPNTQINEVENLVIFDNNGKEIYKKLE
ncbi:hypothetical protein [Paenibacillus sp. AD87]|uniref:hypothetical protein n=1 Tax=Paenibacillus sp. AD87 TaxID=1528787 RepID=UPI0007E37AC3|nr:hypothetical protein [Paenibacillus sp. AD87]OAX49431.1 1-pyrroline-5-carboxylate dehydrogenase [Paenibacillus sp. AD87]